MNCKFGIRQRAASDADVSKGCGAAWMEEAPAKLNLGLKVLRRRPDGYHDILSIFQTLDLCDRLRFEPIEEGRTEIVCDNPEIPTDSGNLVFRAVEAVRNATGTSRGVRVVLNKRIPVGAGLGGGSSDAAATLRGLDRWWSLFLPQDRLKTLAGELGSDVPFFLRRGTAVVTGRGERLRYVSWAGRAWYLLVYPRFQVSSGWAYRNLKIGLTIDSKYISFLDSVNERKEIPPDALFNSLENDFLPLVKTAFPEVERILQALQVSGAAACSLSGSGSTLYGVFSDRARASEAASDLQDLGYPLYLCRPG